MEKDICDVLSQVTSPKSHSELSWITQQYFHRASLTKVVSHDSPVLNHCIIQQISSWYVTFDVSGRRLQKDFLPSLGLILPPLSPFFDYRGLPLGQIKHFIHEALTGRQTWKMVEPGGSLGQDQAGKMSEKFPGQIKQMGHERELGDSHTHAKWLSQQTPTVYFLHFKLIQGTGRRIHLQERLKASAIPLVKSFLKTMLVRKEFLLKIQSPPRVFSYIFIFFRMSILFSPPLADLGISAEERETVSASCKKLRRSLSITVYKQN